MNVISFCLCDYEDLKFIVFCSEYVVVKYVVGILDDNFELIVELYLKMVILLFLILKKIKILVCDRDGEDGFNLYGGWKVIIYYSLFCLILCIE